AVALQEDHLVDGNAHRVAERDAEPLGHVVQLGVRADAGAATGQLLGVAFEHDRVPADAAQHVGGEQSADRPTDDKGARHSSAYRVISSSAARTSAESLTWPARTFCSICSGVLAPAITLAVTGCASSQPNASSSIERPARSATPRICSAIAQFRSLSTSEAWWVL